MLYFFGNVEALSKIVESFYENVKHLLQFVELLI